MEAAAAPVSLKGTREPLSLIATGAFLFCIGGPVAGTISSAGLAFGLRDLRKVDSAPAMGRWRGIGEISAWCVCVLNPLSHFVPAAGYPTGVGILLALFATASALHLLAQAPESASLVRYFSITRWALILPWIVVPLLFLLLPESALERPPQAGLVIFLGPPVILGILTLLLRKAARPYGKRVREHTA